MTAILDALETFLQMAPGLAPLPPNRDSLTGFNPDQILSGIHQDREQGIIMMPQASCGERIPDLDGGDSAHRTGVAAFCNSEPDKRLLPEFMDKENPDRMFRHPTQVPWNNTNNSSMDQLRGYMVGCWRAGQSEIASRLLEAHRKRGWFCQNIHAPERCPKLNTSDKAKDPDFMQPHEIMCLNIAAGNDGAYLDPGAQFWLWCAIMVADRDPKTDNNNLMLLSIVCGRLNVFVAAHPNWREFVKWYWRSQAPMGEAVIAVVEIELKRYPDDAIITLLPIETIKLLASLNFKEEFEKGLDPTHHLQLGQRFAEAALRDAADIFTRAMALSVEEALNRLKKLDPAATAEQLTKALHKAVSGPPEEAIREGLKNAGFPIDEAEKAIRAVFPSPPAPPGVKIPDPVEVAKDPVKIITDPPRPPDPVKIIKDLPRPKWP